MSWLKTWQKKTSDEWATPVFGPLDEPSDLDGLRLLGFLPWAPNTFRVGNAYFELKTKKLGKQLDRSERNHLLRLIAQTLIRERNRMRHRVARTLRKQVRHRMTYNSLDRVISQNSILIFVIFLLALYDGLQIYETCRKLLIKKTYEYLAANVLLGHLSIHIPARELWERATFDAVNRHSKRWSCSKCYYNARTTVRLFRRSGRHSYCLRRDQDKPVLGPLLQQIFAKCL